MNEIQSLLTTFANQYVSKDFRERFVHEAMRKPGKLQERICHSINKIFANKHKNGNNPFSDDDICVVITGTGVETLSRCRWADIESSIMRGFGLLVISADGQRFLAETEAEQGNPSTIFSSSISS